MGNGRPNQKREAMKAALVGPDAILFEDRQVLVMVNFEHENRFMGAQVDGMGGRCLCLSQTGTIVAPKDMDIRISHIHKLDFDPDWKYEMECEMARDAQRLRNLIRALDHGYTPYELWERIATVTTWSSATISMVLGEHDGSHLLFQLGQPISREAMESGIRPSHCRGPHERKPQYRELQEIIGKIVW
jgi:hypothetical protein